MTTANPNIGLALGGGGARGLAHLVVLEAFDELGIKPVSISGTSIGALIGAAYASGLTAIEIRKYCDLLLAKRSAVLRHIYARQGKLWTLLNPRTPALFDAQILLRLLLPPDLPTTFEDLDIPLITVSTDYCNQCQHVSRTGALLPALSASAALPGVFAAVKHDDRILIDGGFVNPLPFDLVQSHSAFTVAVDVSGGVSELRGRLPRTIETLVAAQQIALKSIINAKLETSTPDLIVRPHVGHFGVLDFLKKDEIYAAALPQKDQVKRALDMRFSRAFPK